VLLLSPKFEVDPVLFRAVVKLLEFVKMRTYSSSGEELWRETWKNPLEEELRITNPEAFLQSLHQAVEPDA
jgi:proteasome activator subunit 4